jgi:hypothetical protein
VGPLEGADGDLGAPTINTEKTVMTGPLGGADGDLRVPTINAKKNIDDRLPGPVGGPVSIRDSRGVM